MKADISEALRDLSARLHEHLPDQVLSLVLFGSQARGDARSDSDVDVLVLVRRRTSKVWDVITETAADVSLDWNISVSVLILSAARWKRMRTEKMLLAQNIEAEGVPIWSAR